MNREELERLIAEVQHRQSELNDVEVKSARAARRSGCTRRCRRSPIARAAA